MQKIFRILVLMLTTALVACGGGGGSSGSNPNQPTLITTAGTEIFLPTGAAREYQISGGVAPYRVGNTEQAIAIGQVSDSTLTIGAVSAGSAKVNVFDNKGASVAIGVKVGSSIALYTTAPSSLTIGVGTEAARTFSVGGGSAPYTVEDNNSSVAVVQMLSGNQWKVTGIAKGSANIKIRDAAGIEIVVSLEVGSPELRISPEELTIPIGVDAVAKLSGGQPPYRVAGGIPAAVTAFIQVDELHIRGSLASELDVSVIDAAGQIVKIKVKINTSTTSIRLSPSAIVVSENDNQPIKLSIFGATAGPICVFTSDPTYLQPTVPGCALRTTVTLDTGTRGSRCVTGDKVVQLTVIDANSSVGTAQITIADNGSCGNFAVLPVTARVRAGGTTQLAITGGSGTYIVSSDNSGVATATASGVVAVVSGVVAGNAAITIRDVSDTSKFVTFPVTVAAP